MVRGKDDKEGGRMVRGKDGVKGRGWYRDTNMIDFR